MLVHSDFFVYFHLFTLLCVVLKGHKSLFYIQTKLHVMLSYYSVCAVLAEYGWYRYYMLVHSDFFVYFHLFTPLCVVLKGSKPLPSIGTKLHNGLVLCVCSLGRVWLVPVLRVGV
jgi:hypothetical protein